MCEPIPVEPSRFFDFIGDDALTVVFVPVHPSHPFNPALCHHMKKGPANDVVFGSVDFVHLVLGGGPALPFLHQGLYACGGPSDFGVLPGYWLFKRGEVLAWDSGLPRVADARAVAQSALVGAIFSGMTRKLAFIGQALRLAAEEVVAQRIALGFLAAAAAGPSAARARRPPAGWSTADELLRAYQVIGVPPTATDQEVQEAWRKRRLEMHPDRAAGDPGEFQRRSRISVELNRARDLIFSHRARVHPRRTA